MSVIVFWIGVLVVFEHGSVEGFFACGFIGDGSFQQSDDAVRYGHGRYLSSGEDVVADGYLFINIVDYSGIYPFVMAAKEKNIFFI